jgi:translation initiation factor IF-1
MVPIRWFRDRSNEVRVRVCEEDCCSVALWFWIRTKGQIYYVEV